MSWNGNGTFTRTLGSAAWQGDAAAGTKIVANRHDTNDTDMATGINACVAKNGENAFTGTTGTSAFRGAIDNTSDLGSVSLRWRNLYAGTSIIFQGASFSTTTTAAPTANRAILLPDASGTIALTSQIPPLGCLVIAYLTADQNIADDTVTEIGAGGATYTEIVDTGSNFDPATGRFTAPATGVYLFSFSATLGAKSANVTERFTSYIADAAFTGGSIPFVGSTASNVGSGVDSSITSTGGGLVSLTSGAVRSLWVQQVTGATRFCEGGVEDSTKLTIMRIS